MNELMIKLPDEKAQENFGSLVARLCPDNFVFFLAGELGAGKTTFTRGFLRGLGYEGNVKSPTYTLVEAYEVAGREINHFDLYRLSDPEELEYMGMRDFSHNSGILLIEWPEKGEGMLPQADILVRILYADKGRDVILTANSDSANQLLKQIDQESL